MSGTANKVSGFTLIELMIVVAIIGILAAFALPAYSIYTKRSHVAEGFSLAGSVKVSLSDYYAAEGKWPTDNEGAGLSDPAEYKGNAVESITVSGSEIIILYDQKVDNQTLVIKGQGLSGGVSWNCDGGTLDSRYRPHNCRS